MSNYRGRPVLRTGGSVEVVSGAGRPCSLTGGPAKVAAGAKIGFPRTKVSDSGAFVVNCGRKH